ncbi:MAG TPA: toprim domain-containing protein [Caulobacteraceae bacterium]|nr:toprim domain-containing protein [Caulobacteraceae bacterium]
MRDPEIERLAGMVADDIENVIAALHLSVARRDRRRLYCHAPWSKNAKPKLEISLSPRGKWNDWEAGRFGDALGLVACLISQAPEPKARGALREAIVWARDYFGLAAEGFDKAAWERRCQEAATRREREAAKVARELAENRRTANGLWLAAAALAPGDAGWAYLAARGIDLARLGGAPRAVRVAMAAPWYDGVGDAPSHVGPALMSSMTLANGKFGSLHRTWIDPARPGEKADLDPPRKMWPQSEGAAIRLWRGATGLTEREAADRGVVEDLVLCEGVEDGLSIALMTPELRIVAAGSLPGMLAYTPPKFVRRIIVAADNDWAKPQAQAMLDRACARLHAEFGKLISIARSPEGKDFNDLLRGV